MNEELIRKVTVEAIIIDMQDMMIPDEGEITRQRINKKLDDIEQHGGSGDFVQIRHICQNVFIALKQLGYVVSKHGEA